MSMDRKWLFLCVIFSFFQRVLLDFHSSVYTLTVLAKEEGRLINGLDRYVRAREKNEGEVDAIIKSFLDKLRTDVKTDNDVIIDNPIDSFFLLKRWVKDWQHCIDIILCPDCTEEESVDFSITKGIVEKRLNGWPTEVELKAVVSSIFRLWDVYEFSLNDFINGKIFDFQTKPFSTRDVIYIANLAEELGNFYGAIRFLETLLEEVPKGTINTDGIPESKLTRMLAAAYNRNDMPWKSVEILEKYIKKDPDNKNLKQDYDFFKSKADMVPESERHELIKPNTNINVIMNKDVYYEEDLLRDYKALCKGQLKSAKEQSRLFCYYRQTKDIFYRVKTELANKQPRVFIFHDVITEKEMDFFRNTSKSNLVRSSIVLDYNANVGEAELRVSKTAWLYDPEYPILENISQRVELITGLQTTYNKTRSNSEPFQVLNYGIGGMYRPHLDPLHVSIFADKQIEGLLNEDIIGTGDRIATFLFYLSDVMYGGATVYPKIKARIPVQKGSAAFWYNLKLDGSIDDDTWHAGCPVLVGSKWVSNKWIREAGQIFQRPCGLKQKSKDKQF